MKSYLIIFTKYVVLYYFIYIIRAQKMAAREKLQALRWEDEQLSAIDARANQIEELNALGTY